MSRESVSVMEAAKMLDVSRWTIWRMMRDGQLQAFRVRGCKRIYLGDIQRLKRDNKIKHVAACSTR